MYENWIYTLYINTRDSLYVLKKWSLQCGKKCWSQNSYTLRTWRGIDVAKGKATVACRIFKWTSFILLATRNKKFESFWFLQLTNSSKRPLYSISFTSFSLLFSYSITPFQYSIFIIISCWRSTRFLHFPLTYPPDLNMRFQTILLLNYLYLSWVHDLPHFISCGSSYIIISSLTY